MIPASLKAAARLDEPASRYLLAPPARVGVTTLFLLSALYLFAENAQLSVVFSLLLLLVVLSLLRANRLLVYLLVGAAICAFVAIHVFDLSTGPLDPIADRDEQLEYATRGFLEGKNPWTVLQPSGNPNSAGPASVLLATGPIALFDRINELTFAFYLLFFLFLLYGDVRCKNDTFVLLSLLFLIGPFAFQHSLLMSLEELYYGYLFLAAAWLFAERGWMFGTGVWLVCAVCHRPSYAFPVAAFLCWNLYRRGQDWRSHARIAAGGAVGFLALMLPFLFVLGSDLFVHHPLSYPGVLLSLRWPETNPLFVAANSVAGPLGGTALSAAKAILGLAVVWWVSRRWAATNPEHPFWHLCLGGFVATMLVYLPGQLGDYMPFFVVPGLMAIAFSRARRPQAAPEV